jgi:hypothetical protein
MESFSKHRLGSMHFSHYVRGMGESNRIFFWVRSCLYVKSDSVHTCAETFFIFQEILRAKSDAGASMQFDRRPMALPYPYGRRLEESNRMAMNVSVGVSPQLFQMSWTFLGAKSRLSSVDTRRRKPASVILGKHSTANKHGGDAEE